MRILAVLWLAGCTLGTGAPAAWACERVALRDLYGEPDACDVSACGACVGACGSGCVILEEYPPRYACDGDAWDVFDACPEWQLPQS